MEDIRSGSPNMKIISKRLFREYQNMSRDRERHDDQMEMATMYNIDSSTKIHSSEARNTFTSLEK